MRTWLRRLLVTGASTCLLFLGALLVIEESGLLARIVRQRLARELGPLGERLTLEHAELAWFEPGIELIGLALAPSGQAGTGDLELERLHATFSRGLDELRALRIEGGRVLLGPRLFDDWNRLAPLLAEQTGHGPAPLLPPASIANLEVALELFDQSSFELGTLALCARAGSAGEVELAGRLAPSLAGAIVAPDPIRVSGSLSRKSIRLWSSARDLALEARALPAGALLRPLPLVDGSARLTLDGSFELDFTDSGDSPRPRGHVRASLTKGRLRLAPDRPPIDDLSLELEAELAPASGADPWTRASWDGCAALRARVEATPVWLWAQIGRDVPENGWLRAWGRAQGAPLDRQALMALGLEPGFTFAREMLAPSGRLDLALALVIGRERASWTHDLALQVRSQGEVGLAYRGFPGDPNSGIALPLSNVRGELVAGARTNAVRPWRLSAFDLSADHGSGSVSGWTQVSAPELRPGAFPQPEFDLVLSSPSLAVDPALLGKLAENQYLDWIGPTFAPENGTVAGDFRVRTGPELGGTGAAGALRLQGLSLRWSDLPVQMDDVAGELVLLWSRELSSARAQPLLKRRSFGVAYRLDNRGEGSRLGARAGVRGWVREPALPPVFDPDGPASELMQELHIEIDELLLKGRDFETLATRFPALEQQVAVYGAVGTVRVRFHGTRAALSLPFRSTIQATPIGVNARPLFFQRQTRNLNGRILIENEEGPQGEISAAQLVLSGNWPSGVELITHGRIPATGEARLYIYGAGIDPSNTSFKGALITTLSSGSQASGGIDLSGLSLEGPVDIAIATRFDPASPAPPENRYEIQLRDNDLRARDLLLHDLHGTLEQADEVLASPLVEATLGAHPLELRNVRAFPFSALPRVSESDAWLAREGFWKDPQGRALQADLFTLGLPLDAEHLAGLLDASALESLRENPLWRGAIDVIDARLVVTSEADDQGKVAVRGKMRLYDLGTKLGLPIQVDTASVNLEELVLESGRFRGWAQITGLNARIAERELSEARMIAGYVDGRLTIDNLSGDFEGGRLESLGGALGGASKALGIDLAEPHRFDVAMRLSDVNVGGLLRGVFQSSIADEGVLDGTLQLSGTPGEILALTGRGTLSLDEGALWSIPVMRELLAQLGFDKSGLFDQLRSRFELRAGRVQVSHLEIRSSLLDLVGEGWQDLDGQLSYDLEVRYSLLDKLGPVGRMLYWLNNNLMRVAVRGDFERPEVTIRNSILELLSSFEGDPPRRLPLPDFSTLGPRF